MQKTGKNGKDINIVTKDFFQINAVLLKFLFIKNKIKILNKKIVFAVST